MADGDIFRKLGKIYIKPYKWLCEGKANTAECARIVMNALKQDVKIKGDLPIILAQRMGAKLTQILKEVSEFSSIDWGSVNKEIEKIVQVEGRHDLKEISLRAGKKFLQEFRYGYRQKIDANSASESIFGNYINEVFESGFSGCIPLTDKHHGGVDVVTLEGRIKEIMPEVATIITDWAKKAIIDRTVEKLRLPTRRRLNTIDMDENLC
ncbi:MAG: hypothetical protein LH649_03280 [Pseudanabaena sp. CAN_BIN31]|nr:hypothetical protein [Pseudanabaena sp. CAN_BIN31]